MRLGKRNDPPASRFEMATMSSGGLTISMLEQRSTRFVDRLPQLTRKRKRYISAVFILICFGLPSRQMPDVLPTWYVTYAGDFLWAMLIFFLYGLVFDFSGKKACWFAIVTTYSIECSQLFHPAWLDSLRSTKLGGLVLGFGFLWSDICAYSLGIATGVGINRVIMDEPKKEHSADS